MDVARVLEATSELITPVGVIDDEIVERNLARMAKLAANHSVKLRPHAKTHKSGEMARRQIAHGATGVTCATMTEAEVFAGAGVDDILIAHPPVGQPKLKRLAAVRERVKRLAVSLDSVEIAKALPSGIDVYWEVDPGQHRLGTLPGEPTANAVRQLLRAIGAERFRGLISHGGHAYASTSLEQRQRAAHEEADSLLSSAELLRNDGIEIGELSVGSTPTAGLNLRSGITEMRPGTYIYGDANNVALGSIRLEDCALAVVATVVSIHPDRIVVDAGSKALSADLRVGLLRGYGMVLDHPNITVERLSEEHAVLTGSFGDLRVGEGLVIVPSHACTVANLHPAMLLLSPDGKTRWLKRDAHGWDSRY